MVPAGMTMPELALRHILEHPAVSTVIPGMRKLRHVEQNIGVSDGQPLPAPPYGRSSRGTGGTDVVHAGLGMSRTLL